MCLLLANLSPNFQYVKVLNSRLGENVRIKRLDESTAEEATRSPETFRSKSGLLQQTSSSSIELSLLPYAIIRVDPAREHV